MCGCVCTLVGVHVCGCVCTLIGVHACGCVCRLGHWMDERVCPPPQRAQLATLGQRVKLEWVDGGHVWDRQRVPCFPACLKWPTCL